jgi:hypothetical protein
MLACPARGPAAMNVGDSVRKAIDDWRQGEFEAAMLTHYTGDIQTVTNILREGFAWFCNRRRLADLLIPQHDDSTREPQQFGMISFTEIEPQRAKAHCDRFVASVSASRTTGQ